MKIMGTSKFTTTIVLSLSILLFLSNPSPSFAAAAKCNAGDKAALLQIKAAFNNPDALSTWNPNTDCCNDFWLGIECNNGGRVITLSLVEQNISGPISPVVGNLQYLQELELNTLTKITGTIPSTITNLNRLNILRIRSSLFSGSIPAFLSTLKSLTELDLSDNLISGPIPASLSQLPNILNMYLGVNRLTGPIPESFGHFVGKTPNLYLSNNRLSGTLPKSLGYVNFTTEVDLSGNGVSGDASMLFGKNKTVTHLMLNGNKFNFDLSNVEFPDSLTMLLLDDNKIFGSLPQGLTQLNLQAFDVSNNQLCGQIPQGGQLQSFDSRYYAGNKCLCGAPLPACH